MATNKQIPTGPNRISIVMPLLVSGYVATYCALLNPIIVANEAHLGMITDGYREPDYRAGGNIARIVFGPANWIDRQIRREYWADASDS